MQGLNIIASSRNRRASTFIEEMNVLDVFQERLMNIDRPISFSLCFGQDFPARDKAADGTQMLR